jgi:hypothetical protein
MTPEDRSLLISDLLVALKSSDTCLDAEEQQWVKNAIKAQNDMERLRKAIIEKTLAGLVWAAIIGVAYLFVDFLRNHGLKI